MIWLAWKIKVVFHCHFMIFPLKPWFRTLTLFYISSCSLSAFLLMSAVIHFDVLTFKASNVGMWRRYPLHWYGCWIWIPYPTNRPRHHIFPAWVWWAWGMSGLVHHWLGEIRGGGTATSIRCPSSRARPRISTASHKITLNHWCYLLHSLAHVWYTQHVCSIRMVFTSISEQPVFYKELPR